MSSVDIVVPCYNYGRYLDHCVRSVLGQTGIDIRVLIIDDASTDDTAAIAQAIAAGDSRVTFRRHVANRGNILTYNEGIEWSSADYFLLLSADDWLLPGALVRTTAAFEEHPDVVFVHGNAAVANVGEAAPTIRPQAMRCNYQLLTGQQFIEAACAESEKNRVWTPTAVVRTELQRRIGGYSTKLPHAGDLHLWLRLAAHGSVVKLEALQAVYRKHESNMHRGYAKMKNLRQHLLAFDSAFEEYRDRIADREALQVEYRKNLALSAIRLAQHDLISNELDACDEYESFAIELFPGVRRTNAWRQMRALQMLGHRTAYVLKTLLAPPLKAIRRGARAFRFLILAPE